MKFSMYQIAKLPLLILIVFCLGGCKKFLNVDMVTAMSGNNFWKTRSDVEKYTNGVYSILRQYTCMNGSTLTAIGDLRCTAWEPPLAGAGGRAYISLFNNNDIRGLRNTSESWRGTYNNYTQSPVNFGIENLADWGGFYRVINAANTILENIRNTDLELSDEERAAYTAEAIFVRSVTYFLMVRHWGDVPYLTRANDKEQHPRMDQVQLFRNCITDLSSVLNDLPWTYSDPTKRGVRAMKGGALILMMEMYMWMANFDAAGAETYYQEVVRLGNTLINENKGAYMLLPISDFKVLFKGTTKESLFEIGQDYNSGEVFGLLASIADIALRTPYKKNASRTFIVYKKEALEQLYLPENNGEQDQRADLWFEKTYMYDNNGNFVFTKFINTYASATENENPNDNRILFRYADAYLLRAEALEKLGKKEEAINDINIIRERAGAEPFVQGTTNQFGQTVEDAIWWERERELMGEGAMFYDLVRTRKILSGKYTPHPMTYQDYINGAWTYPINTIVIQRNPLINPNPFWL